MNKRADRGTGPSNLSRVSNFSGNDERDKENSFSSCCIQLTPTNWQPNYPIDAQFSAESDDHIRSIHYPVTHKWTAVFLFQGSCCQVSDPMRELFFAETSSMPK